MSCLGVSSCWLISRLRKSLPILQILDEDVLWWSRSYPGVKCLSLGVLLRWDLWFLRFYHHRSQPRLPILHPSQICYLLTVSQRSAALFLHVHCWDYPFDWLLLHGRFPTISPTTLCLLNPHHFCLIFMCQLYPIRYIPCRIVLSDFQNIIIINLSKQTI